jgi:Glycosyltransferase like family 2
MPDRPPISVVMPFAGDAQAGRAAAAALLGLQTCPGDQLILADNTGTAPELREITVVRVDGERSPAHARNAGAEHARGEWILFLDADCLAPPDLLEAYFAEPIDARVGALAGEVAPAPGGDTLAARYGAARGFLDQQRHLAHSYRPRAVAANLLVRREAFDQLGGFYEGLRAAEDTDFSWRLQEAGWRLEGRATARVEHRYRTTISELRSQWRGYAAGRAWLGRRYEDFAPQPAIARAASRLSGRTKRSASARRDEAPARAGAPGRVERGRYLAIDALLGAEELAGLVLSNRPAAMDGRPEGARVVLVAEHFPTLGDPLVDFASRLGDARVEAIARPDTVAVEPARSLRINYREDDGGLLRLTSAARIALAHPVRCMLDLLRRAPGDVPLRALAPAVRRLERDDDARVHALGPGQAQAIAGRLARLAGRQLDHEPGVRRPSKPDRGRRSVVRGRDSTADRS